MYFPSLSPDTFVRLPDGLVLPGSPKDYRFALYSLPVFGSFEREEAAGRIMMALARHGSWRAIRYFPFVMTFFNEYDERRAHPQGDYAYSLLARGIHGVDSLLEGLRELISRGLLGHCYDGPNAELIWPTPEFLRLIEPYKTTRTV